MKELTSPLPEKQEEYRVLYLYGSNFVANKYELQTKTKFLWWKYWKTIDKVYSSYTVNKWIKFYNIQEGVK